MYKNIICLIKLIFIPVQFTIISIKIDEKHSSVVCICLNLLFSEFVLRYKNIYKFSKEIA